MIEKYNIQENTIDIRVKNNSTAAGIFVGSKQLIMITCSGSDENR